MDPKLAGALAASFLLGAGAGATGGELLGGEATAPVELAAEAAPDLVQLEAEKVTEAEALAEVRATTRDADCDALEAVARSSARGAEKACATYQAGLAGADDVAGVRTKMSGCEAARSAHATDQAANLACRDGLRFWTAVYERKVQAP